MLSDQH